MGDENVIRFWMNQGLSVRAAKGFVKTGILNEERLAEQMMLLGTGAAVYQFFLSHCGRSTTDEIWTFITNLKKTPAQKNCLTPEETSTLHAVIHDIDEKVCKQIWTRIQNLQSPQVDPENTEADTSDPSAHKVPLLQIEVPEAVWTTLQETSIDSVSWIGRIRRGIEQFECQTLANVAQISQTEWLKLKGFDQISFTMLCHQFKTILDEITDDSTQQRPEEQVPLPSLPQAPTQELAMVAELPPSSRIGQSVEAIQEPLNDSPQTQNTMQFWITEGLSVRAANCLAKADIANQQQLIEKFKSFDDILALRSCGPETTREIWAFIANLKKKDISSDPIQPEKQPDTQLQSPPEEPLVLLPLLNTEVSASMSELLQQTSVNRIPWRVRTQNVIAEQGLQTLADLVQFSPIQWLHFRNFDYTSLTELQKRITEFITTELRKRFIEFITNPTQFDETEATEILPIQVISEDEQPNAQSQEEPSENQRVLLPLLNTEVSASIWKFLQNTPVEHISWSVRTQNVINRQRLQTLAELAQLSPTKWLRFRNFGSTSLSELQKRITEFITDPTQFDQTEATEILPTQITSEDEQPDAQSQEPSENQPVYLPLLRTEVSAETWETLQNTPIHQFTCTARTENVIRTQGLETLAGLAAITATEWLKLNNFGRKSLTEIQEKVSEIIAKSDPLDTTTPSPIETFSELGHAILQRLRTREQEVIRRYHGYEQSPENLRQVGEAIKVTRARVSQVKEAANKKINQGAENHLITTTICRLLSGPIFDALASRNGFCDIKALREVISQKLGWGDAERWLVNWFDEAFGEAWMCLGTELYEVVDRICYLKSDTNNHDFFSQLAMNLHQYGYRPLTETECKTLYQKTDDPALDSTQLLDALEHHQNLKTYQYGETYIGLSEWAWFAPEKTTTVKGKADLAEWYLRMTSEPATSKAIADGIWEKLGNFRLTAMDVVDVLEKQPSRFRTDDNNTYRLYLWDEVSEYHQPLTELLSDGPLPISQIVDRLSVQGPEETKRIVAALNFYKDLFIETVAFEWALRSHKDETEAETDFDPATLTFEDLIPGG